MEQPEIDVNKVIQVKTFFNHAQWSVFEERIKELMACEDSAIHSLLFNNEPISEGQKDFLNFHAAKRRAMLEILCIKEEMLEEVDPEYGEEPKERIGFDVSKPQ